MTTAARAELFHTLHRSWAPHDRRPIADWAADNVILPGAYAIPGAFHVEKSPYLRRAFEAIADDHIRTVTIQAGVQTGKSLVGDVTLCHALCTRPQNIFWNWPTNEEAEAYARRRAMPLFENCPQLAGRMREVERADRHKIRKCELLLGSHWITIQGANEGNLQTYSVPFMVNEEVWNWQPGMLIHAKARASYFEWRKKIINIGQAGDKGCEADQEFDAGSQEEWEIPCPECRHYQPHHWTIATDHRDSKGRPVFAGIVWDTTEITKPDGRWNFSTLAPTIRWRCAHCLHEVPDDRKLRRQMADYGRFTLLNPSASPEHVSLHWPSEACDEVPLATLVEEYLRAKDQERIGNRLPIAEFHKKRRAISYDPAKHLTYELPPTITLTTRADLQKQGWELQQFIFLTVDVQRDHFWGLVQAWSETGLSCVLWAGKLMRWEDIEAKQLEYDVPHRGVFIDSRYRTQEVYRQCVHHGVEHHGPDGREWLCWQAMMGDARRHFQFTIREGTSVRRVLLPYSWPPQWTDPCLGLTDEEERRSLHGKLCPLILMAKGTIDTLAFERRDLMDRGEVSLVAEADWNREFAKQMAGEQPDRRISPLGHEKIQSRKVGPNHLLDCYRMSLTAACIAKILTPVMEARRFVSW